MIRPLRRRHVVAFAVLAAVLPATLFAALLARRPIGRSGYTAGETLALPVLIWERVERLGATDVVARLTADSRPTSRLVLELDPLADIRQPDPLVYWSWRMGVVDTGALPDSRLLGRLAGASARRFALPDEAVARDGMILVYSLTHHRLLGGFGVATQAFRQ